jgi:hypothetical protein
MTRAYPSHYLPHHIEHEHGQHGHGLPYQAGRRSRQAAAGWRLGVGRWLGQVKRRGGGPGWWCSVARRARRQGRGRATGYPSSLSGAMLGTGCPYSTPLDLRLGPLPGPGPAPLGLAGGTMDVRLRFLHGKVSRRSFAGLATLAGGNLKTDFVARRSCLPQLIFGLEKEATHRTRTGNKKDVNA